MTEQDLRAAINLGVQLDNAEQKLAKLEAAERRAPSNDIRQIGRDSGEKSPADIDALLTVLRKHGVSEYNQDNFGVRIKFGSAALPNFAEQLPALDYAKPPPGARTEPKLPPDGVVEPTAPTLDELLYGAK